MPVVLYHFPPSPPSRVALTVAKALGIDVTVKIIDLFKNEHLQEEYLKINPEHMVPAMDDNGLILHDSHVIATYLVSRYGKDESLYPKDVKQRALVDQRLYFEATVLLPRLRATTYPVFFLGKRNVDADARDAIYEALGNLEKYLEPTGWVAGDHATLADISCSVTVASLEAIGVDMSAYPKIRDWLKRCRSTFRGYEEANAEGEKLIGDGIKSIVGPKAYLR
ncbi:glutathione S-transferase D7-like isoform X1 [Schistocerca serialis cubense]|uniref:glutathione S-transferase D7-like isoform X1 n=1 Tax=Schistocerca serialis cubense TaxID=2023355 RepID=UPI00214EBF3F|nr:glutathione S-transferase D7-like isoform X1 [Schistocerca serialis cubense]XP_049937468.1 glutathione S-transferase D7-like isoform X1 [Schistocerca serialis cubense]XP_049937469.1 glutathione S-transferase D7-like isoform X1 [Schistocerca serialis cubense]